MPRRKEQSIRAEVLKDRIYQDYNTGKTKEVEVYYAEDIDGTVLGPCYSYDTATWWLQNRNLVRARH